MTDREERLERILEILREPARLSPDFTQRVMSEIHRLPHPESVSASRPEAWWRRQWTVRLSPLRSLGLAAGLALVVLGAVLAGRQTRPEAAPGVPAAESGQPTQFVLVAPEASAVALVGDFNDWSVAATPLRRAEGDGVWHVTVPLAPGRYRYSFVVDGKIWRSDPEASATEDEFGRPNSVVTVGGA